MLRPVSAANPTITSATDALSYDTVTMVCCDCWGNGSGCATGGADIGIGVEPAPYADDDDDHAAKLRSDPNVVWAAAPVAGPCRS